MARSVKNELEPWEDAALSYALQGLPVSKIATIIGKDESTIRASSKKDTWKREWRRRIDPMRQLIVAKLQEAMSDLVFDDKKRQKLRPTDIVAMYKCLEQTVSPSSGREATVNLRAVFNLPAAEVSVARENPMFADLAELALESGEDTLEEGNGNRHTDAEE